MKVMQKHIFPVGLCYHMLVDCQRLSEFNAVIAVH